MARPNPAPINIVLFNVSPEMIVASFPPLQSKIHRPVVGFIPIKMPYAPSREPEHVLMFITANETIHGNPPCQLNATVRLHNSARHNTLRDVGDIASRGYDDTVVIAHLKPHTVVALQMAGATFQLRGVRVESVSRRHTSASVMRDVSGARVQRVERPQERPLPAFLTEPAGTFPDDVAHLLRQRVPCGASAAAVGAFGWLRDGLAVADRH
jgi:hypothetical protein